MKWGLAFLKLCMPEDFRTLWKREAYKSTESIALIRNRFVEFAKSSTGRATTSQVNQ